MSDTSDACSFKEGTGRGLRRLHDVTTQHFHALKLMGYDPSGPFILNPRTHGGSVQHEFEDWG